MGRRPPRRERQVVHRPHLLRDSRRGWRETLQAESRGSWTWAMQFGEVRIPTETIIELKGGKKKETQRKFFPGVHPGGDRVRTARRRAAEDLRQGVARGQEHAQGDGFRRNRQEADAARLRRRSIAILEQVVSAKEKPKPKYVFEKGEPVKIIDGPFNNFTGARSKRSIWIATP